MTKYAKNNRSRNQRVFAFFLMMLVLFNFPIISIANIQYFLQYIPSLFLYLLIVWFVSIIILYFLIERDKFPDKKN